MSRLGTCAFAHQIQEIEYIPIDEHQPHLRSHVETCPESYTCQFFDDHELPPPMRRFNGSFEIREGDCEACPYYIPAGDKQLIRALRKKRLKRRKPKAKVSS
jgi:hypothetical protein